MANGNLPGVIRNEIDNSFVSQINNSSYAGVMGRATKGIANSKVLVHSEPELINTFGYPIVSGSFPLVSAIDYGIYAGIVALQETSNLWYVRLTDGTEKYASVVVPTYDGTSGTSVSAVSGTTSALSVAPSTSYPNLVGYSEGNTPKDNYDLRVLNGVGAGLRFSSIGPGVDGNNLAVAIYTKNVAGTSLSGVYDWANKYDDYGVSANKRADKIFKVCVFTKQATQSFDSAWWSSVSGAPIETFYASTDFTMLDNGGNSLFVEDVINGNSYFIYVTSNKVDGTLPSYTTSGFGFAGGALPTTLSTLNASTIWSVFENREVSPLNTAIAIPRAKDTYTDATELNAIDSLVGRRKDFVGFVQATSLTSQNYNSIVSDNTNIVVASNPSYFGKYVGWHLVLDRYNSSRVYLPNCIFAAAVSLRSDRIGKPWDAPAGIDRGLIQSGKQNVNLSPTVAGTLYDRFNLNTFKFVNGLGYVVWGQKTAQLKTTARDRLNVRKLLIYIENNSETILNGFVFQGNTVKARERVTSLINSFLQTVLSGEGVQSYKVVCNSSNNNATTIAQNILVCDIYVQPTYTIEFIQLNTIISSDSVSVSEV
jgi:hypothetical protein